MLTIGELLYVSYRTGKPEMDRTLIDNIDIAARVIPVDRRITDKAAALKAGRSIPYFDSLILATFLLNGCKTIHTTERFSKIKNEGIRFVVH